MTAYYVACYEKSRQQEGDMGFTYHVRLAYVPGRRPYRVYIETRALGNYDALLGRRLHACYATEDSAFAAMKALR